MRQHKRWVWFSAGLVLLLLSIGCAFTQQIVPSSNVEEKANNADAAQVAQAIKSIIDVTHHPDLKWPNFPHYQDEMQMLYEVQAYRPIWIEQGRPTKQARDVIDSLAEAEAKGLNPIDYDAALLDRQWRELNSELPYSARELALFDTAISLELMRYISDLHIGRVNPKNLNFGLNIERKKYDLAALVSSAIAEDRIRETVAEAEPLFPQYRRLKKALSEYRRLADDPALGPVPVAGAIRPGDAYAGLNALRRLLTALGDLPSDAGPMTGGNVYKGAIVDAVKRFQSRHGLKPDGVIGKTTYASLNVTPRQRLRQLELALERLRWLPAGESGRFIVVNIPGFRLWAFDSIMEQEDPSIAMNVVVGEAIDQRKTPIFIEDMRYVIFRPYWNVPHSITSKEILPKLKRNRGYLRTQNMEIVSSFSDSAKPLPVTAENIAKLATGALKVRQRPGPRNALGLVKFIFPNNHSVYLHSTPQQELFQRARRDFSHGCIRVEDPVALAEFVLSGKGGWDRARIRSAMNGKASRRVNLDTALPVLIFYTTAVVGADDTVYFYDDVYGHDATLDRVLLAGYPYAP